MLQKKDQELELATVKTSTSPPQQQPNHQKCEEKMTGLTKQLSEAHGTIENLQRICRERTLEIANLQEKVIDSNNLAIRLQQQTSDQHLKTNERLTSINAQLFEFLNANTGRWTDGTKGKVPQNSPDPTTNLLNVTPGKAVHLNPLVQDTHRPVTPPSNPPVTKPPQNTQPKEKSPPIQNTVASMDKGKPNGMKAPTVRPKIIYFKGASHSLSNWAPCNLMYLGTKFSSVEQAYFHRLLTEHGEHQLATQILKLEDASDVKTVGESVNVSDGWKKRRADILMDIMSTKFKLPTFQDELLATYPNELHHNVASNYWGIGLKRQGQNITGRILMEIREKLHKEKSKGTQTLAASPDVLLVRDSQLRGFNADKISGVNFTSEKMRSAQEAAQKLRSRPTLPPTVILHLLADNLQKESVSKVTSDIQTLVKDIKQHHGSRVLVSLGLPVDDLDLTRKIKAASILLKSEGSIETICHGASFTKNGYVNYSLYHDWIHPNERGMRRLAVNLKEALQ